MLFAWDGSVACSTAGARPRHSRTAGSVAWASLRTSLGQQIRMGNGLYIFHARSWTNEAFSNALKRVNQ